jgi:hypothetical protein
MHLDDLDLRADAFGAHLLAGHRFGDGVGFFLKRARRRKRRFRFDLARPLTFFLLGGQRQS